MIDSFLKWLRRVVTQPRQELGRWQRAVRLAYDLGRVGGRQLERDNAPQMAAALAFRSLFALIPVLIVGMLVINGIRGTDSFLHWTDEFFASLGLDKITVNPAPETVGDSPHQPISLSKWLQDLIDQAASFNLSAVGWVGGIVIVYAAISLLVTVENCCNTIFRAPQGRSWMRRIPLYWFVLTIGPLAIALAWYVSSGVSNWIESAPAAQPLLVVAHLVWSFATLWLVLLTVYMLLPNTWVDPRAAAIGALFCAILLEVGKQTLAAYLQNAFAVNQLYGSLGLLPLFMLWIYLMWLFILFGLEVSSTVQSLRDHTIVEVEEHAAVGGLRDPAVVIEVMQTVAQRFAQQQTSTVHSIAAECGLKDSDASTILELLVEHRFVNSIEGNERSFALACPADAIAVDELMRLGFRLVSHRHGDDPSDFLVELRDAQLKVVGQMTLADLSAAGTVNGA